MNRLASATSPYLLQHAENPVDWYEWGDEAFERARAEDRPLLVSVGYSSCHWCHVMAHESFESETTAALMNELFVNVKVDREERPDVDAVTMEATVGMTGSGGWPTTVFMTPEGKPFYAGTYFPPEPHHGLPSFHELLRAVADTWRERRDDIEAQAARIDGALRATAGSEALDRAADVVAARRSRSRCRRDLRAGVRRLRTSAEVPGCVDARVPPAPRRRGVHDDGDGDARRDGGGRVLRRRGRRLPPLLGRRPLARPALREDALRQRRSRLDVPARLGRDRARRATARSSRRRSSTCCASSRSRTAGSRRRRTPTRTASRG